MDVKKRLAEMGLSPKRSLGQNFLVSPSVIGKIVAEARALNPAALVEIGPGLGALTEPLIAAGLSPRLIELDHELAAYWRGRGLEVIEGDALRMDWAGLNLPEGSVLVSNLPYQISSSLVLDRAQGPPEVARMILMFQKEVAERIQARPGTKAYGLLSVITQSYFEVRRVVDAGPRDFFPAPKVASRVLAFRRVPGPARPARFLTFVKGAFAQRRKFLLKNLLAVLDKQATAKAAAALPELGHDDKVRAEQLSPAEFARLFERAEGT